MTARQPMPSEAELRVSWRWVSIISVCLFLAATTALIVVASISDAAILETVALVLAVIVFVGQLLIFVAQLAFATTQLQQAERINTETSTMLAEVSSRVARLDETQNQQFREMREQILPRALYPPAYGERLLEVLDRSIDQVAYSDPGLANKLEEELSPVREAINSNIEKEVSTETVECPLCCSTTTVVQIGVAAGESAHAHCASCGQHFHVHRDGQGEIRTVAPGGGSPVAQPNGEPESVLRRAQMLLPDKGDRLRILQTILDEWKAGRIHIAGDITRWMEHPSRIRTPLAFSLLNREYGLLRAADGPGTLTNKEIEPPPADLEDKEWIDLAHSAWIAQALFRLTAWRRTETQELKFFFGDRYTDEDLATLNRARGWDLEQKSLRQSEPGIANSPRTALVVGSDQVEKKEEPPT